MLFRIFSSAVFLPLAAFAQEAGNLVAPATGAQAGQPPGWLTPVWLVGMFFFFWLFVFRPQAKRAKEHKKFLQDLQVGSEVVTSGGLIGRVTAVTDTIINLDFGQGNVKVLKSAISGKLDTAAAVKV